jgi:plastocyanin domain-containing protein
MSLLGHCLNFYRKSILHQKVNINYDYASCSKKLSDLLICCFVVAADSTTMAINMMAA